MKISTAYTSLYSGTNCSNLTTTNSTYRYLSIPPPSSQTHHLIHFLDTEGPHALNLSPTYSFT